MFRNTNCCGGHNGGVDRLTKICTDRIISTLTKENWYEPYALGKRTHGLLCQHAKEQVMRFMATNLTKLDNAAELLTIEDLDVVLRRTDLNCTTEELLLFLFSASAFKSLPDNQKVFLLNACVTRKPAEVLLVGGGRSRWHEFAQLESMEVFNCLSNTWSRVPDHVNFPMRLEGMQMELINNVVYTVGGYRCFEEEDRVRERGEER